MVCRRPVWPGEARHEARLAIVLRRGGVVVAGGRLETNSWFQRRAHSAEVALINWIPPEVRLRSESDCRGQNAVQKRDGRSTTQQAMSCRSCRAMRMRVGIGL